MSKSISIAFNASVFFAGSAGIIRFACSAADALLSGPLAGQVRFFAPSCRRGQMPAHLAATTTYFPAPDPRRGTAFNHLFWANLLSLHLRRMDRKFLFYSPSEVHALVPFPRTALTIHDCYSDRYGDPRRKKPGVSTGRRFQISQMRRSHLLSISRFTSVELAQLHGFVPPQVITAQNWLPRSFDPHPSSEQLNNLRLQLQLPSRFWLYVGGFRLNKNLPFLLEAYFSAKQQCPLPPLVIAGQLPDNDTPFSGPIRATLNRYNAVSTDVILPGYIANEDLPSLYKLAALTICPSYYEGFGYPVVESLAVGTPLLAARAASYPELVSNPACLFSPTDPSELINSLKRAAESERDYLSVLSPDFLPPAGEARFNAAIHQAVYA